MIGLLTNILTCLKIDFSLYNLNFKLDYLLGSLTWSVLEDLIDCVCIIYFRRENWPLGEEVCNPFKEKKKDGVKDFIWNGYELEHLERE